MTASGKSYTERAELDPTITLDYIRAVRGAYARDQELTSPMLSPLFGDFRGFPPTLIQAGSNELLLSDSVRLRDRMQAAGVPCRLEVWTDMWHVFQMFPHQKGGPGHGQRGALPAGIHMKMVPVRRRAGGHSGIKEKRSRAAPAGAALSFLG